MDAGHRRVAVLRGDPETTALRAAELVRFAAPHAVEWVGPGGSADTRALGGTFDVVVFDAHCGLDPSALARVAGSVRGGGWLVVRSPMGGLRARVDAFARDTWHGAQPTGHLVARIESALAACEASDVVGVLPVYRPVAPDTAEQDALVAELIAAWRVGARAVFSITAARGRGKSAAIGRTLAAVDGAGVVVAPTEAGRAEIQRFCVGRAGRTHWSTDLRGLPRLGGALIVDEAAQFPVDALRRAIADTDAGLVVLATTTHGYEGTGRGFAVRLLPWLRVQAGAGLRERTLSAPIRWRSGDPLEAALDGALLHDAAEHAVLEHAVAGALVIRPAPAAELAMDEPLLRGVFGLLVSSHYRTAPADLHALLDAPNVRVHVALLDDVVVGACVVALEGGLDDAAARALRTSGVTVRGHALADVFAVQLGIGEAASLRLVRSVRIATHPQLRRAGVARRLVEDVHGAYDADVFGTMFGATAELVAFRRSLGYEPVRFSPGRGARSGEPSVVCARAVSAKGAAVVARARAELAAELDEQLALLGEDDGSPVAPPLAAALREALPVRPVDEDADRARARRYAFGGCTAEAVAGSVRAVASRPGALDGLDPAARALIEARVLRRAGWPVAAAAAGYRTTREAMRALRRAMAVLLEPSAPTPAPSELAATTSVRSRGG